ncbi:MAG: serine hydrolase [Bacteroidota bacterium]|nr:serine hydrolase [Bacteroidota bacterium]
MSGKPVLIISILITILLLNSCHNVRYFTWNVADVKDYKRFPAANVHAGDDVFTFARQDKAFRQLPRSFLRDGESFQSFLERNKSTVFLVIHKDTILYEQYFRGHSGEDIFPSFSVTKSVVSALVGIALSEGLISSMDDPVSKYLPNWLRTDLTVSASET